MEKSKWHPWRPLPKLFNPWSLDLGRRLYGFIWKVHLFLECILYSKIYLRKKLNAWWWCPLCSLPTIVKFVVPGSGFRWDQFAHILKFQNNSVIQNMPKKITEGKLEQRETIVYFSTYEFEYWRVNYRSKTVHCWWDTWKMLICREVCWRVCRNNLATSSLFIQSNQKLSDMVEIINYSIVII